MSFLAKLFITSALIGYSYLLVTEITVQKQFDTGLISLTKLPQLAVIPAEYLKLAVQNTVLVRQVVAGLLASSLLVFVCSWLVVLPLFGVILRVAITSNPLTSNSQLTQIEAFKLAAIAGALLVWASSTCGCGSQKQKKQ